MKKIFTILLLLIFCCCLIGCDSDVEYFIGDIPQNLKINDEYQLSVYRADNNKKLNISIFEWSTSDGKVAIVSPEGELKIIGRGKCIITATNKYSTEKKAEYEIFVPYEIELEEKHTISKKDIYVANIDELEYILKSLGSIGYKVIKYTSTQKVSLLGVGLTILDFFEKGKYLYSRVTYNKTVENGVICELSEWGNSDVLDIKGLIDAMEIHESIKKTLKVDNKLGDSLGAGATTLVKSIELLPNFYDNIYLSELDKHYQYRVVVVCDYNHYVTTNYYMNGLLTGLGLSLKEIFNLDFQALEDNYLYEKNYDEISNISNVRLKIEYRLNPLYTEEG